MAERMCSMKCLLILIFSVILSNADELQIDSDEDGHRWIVEKKALVTSCRLVAAGAESIEYLWLFPNGSSVPEIGDIESQNKTVLQLLHMIKPEKSDSGRYTCVAKYEVNSEPQLMNRSIEINVVDEFKWLNCESNQYLKLGASDQKLDCLVPDVYKDNIIWTRNGKALDDKQYERNNFSLIIKGQVTEEVVDKYLVTVNNEKLRVFDRLEVNVNLFEKPMIKVPNVDEIRVEKNNPKVECRAEGKPAPVYDWLDEHGHNLSLKNENYYVNRLNGTLTFLNTTASTKKFTCFAQNADGEDEHDVNVTMYEKPMITSFHDSTVILGNTATIVCVASGFPLPDIEIGKKDKDVIVESKIVRGTLSATLSIPQVTRDHDGVYYCNVSNKYEETVREVSLSIEYAPNITVPEPVVVACMKNVQLHCLIDAKPAVQVRWQKNGEAVVSNSTHRFTNDSGMRVLSMDFTRKRDVIGNYSCIAKNVHGSGTGNITVVRPKKISPPEKIVIYETTTTSFTLNIQRQKNSCFAVENVLLELRERTRRGQLTYRMFNATANLEVVIADLRQNTEYSIKIALKDENGEISDYSQEIIAKTKKDNLRMNIIVICTAGVIVVLLLDVGLFYGFRCGLIYFTLKFCGCIRDSSEFKVIDTEVALTGLKGESKELCSNGKRGKDSDADVDEEYGDTNDEYHTPKFLESDLKLSY